MGIWNQTSNIAVVVNSEMTTRTSVNNLEAHNRQYILKHNARADYKKYNYSIPTKYDDVKYKEVIWNNLKTGIKYDKSKLEDGEFWAGRVYKKGSGKSTTYCESMIFCPPYRIHPDQIEEFLASKENEYFKDVADFVQTNERFKDCIILGMNVHMNEVYVPSTITLNDGTECLIPEEERWQYAYIKPHMSVDFIPTVKEKDKKTGVEYLKLSRTDVWKSRKGGRYCDSYREFNDDRYEAVDKNYGFDRGEIYSEMKEDERPTIDMSLKEWQKAHDQEKIDKLIEQQKEQNEKAIKQVIEETKQIEIIKQELEEDIEAYTEKVYEKTDEYYIKYKVADRQNKMLFGLVDAILDIIKPLKVKYPALFEKIDIAIKTVVDKIRQSNKFKNEDNYNYDEGR